MVFIFKTLESLILRRFFNTFLELWCDVMFAELWPRRDQFVPDEGSRGDRRSRVATDLA